ncbi:MAG: AAA family ATPase [Candidatus Aerophobetes bacterium]|nr:AAA family ATPase [Candidatus Aerophobetes bacterium]
MNSHKRLFVAATRQNDGKSTISLGLLQILKEKYPRIGFMKPVGQHYVEQEGVKIDEDVVLMRDACGMMSNLYESHNCSRRFYRKVPPGGKRREVYENNKRLLCPYIQQPGIGAR